MTTEDTEVEEAKLLYSMAELHHLASKLPMGNLLVGRLWFELSRQLKSFDLLLSDFALKKANMAVEIYRVDQVIVQEGRRAINEENNLSSFPQTRG